MSSLALIFRNRRYFAPTWLFTSLNIIVSTWVLYLPQIKSRLALTDGEIGIALFSFSLGMLAVIPVSASLFERLGQGRLSFIAVVALAVAMCGPIVAPSYITLCLSLFVAGTCCSLTDIGMNAIVADLEREDEVHFMSAAHGFFSLGGVLGAGIGSLLIAYFPCPVYHSLSVLAFVLLTNGLLRHYYDHHCSLPAERTSKNLLKWSLLKPLLGISVLGILIMGSEGAIEHWSKLYLLDVVHVSSETVAGYGLVAFSATMMLGRFFGDAISKRIGPYWLIIGGSLLAALGFALTLTTTLWPSMLGFAVVGLGFSVIVPELFRLAGNTRGVSTAEGISIVAGVSYVGFIGSPALLGFLSDFSSLRLSFAALLLAAITAATTGLYLKLHHGSGAVPPEE